MWCNSFISLRLKFRSILIATKGSLFIWSWKRLKNVAIFDPSIQTITLQYSILHLIIIKYWRYSSSFFYKFKSICDSAKYYINKLWFIRNWEYNLKRKNIYSYYRKSNLWVIFMNYLENHSQHCLINIKSIWIVILFKKWRIEYFGRWRQITKRRLNW